ncbi:MAG: ATP-binding protein [Planctomycetota bacterium]|nr:ATP-binding protein [Planctomycetota bacterium]
MPVPDMLRVLLIEDDPGDAFLVERMLTRGADGAFEVTHVAWLEEAIRRLRQDPFDAALLDLALPDTNGLETVSNLHKAMPGLPIVVLTGSEQEDLAVQVVKRGAQDCLLKGQVEGSVLRRALRYAMERKELTEQLVRQNEKLRELDRLKSEFISVVSHEMRTPITAMQVALTMLEEGPRDVQDPENKESMAMLRRNTDRLMKMTTDVLDVSRVESGGLQLQVQDVDILTLFRGVIDLTHPLARSKNDKLLISSEHQTLFVQCDPERITQALLNLVNNAITHNSGGIEITLGARVDRDGICVWVHDTGHGIPEEEQDRVFQPFYQVRSRKADVMCGSGLGLSITRGVIEAHGKELWLVSKPGKGCTFFFNLDPQVQRPMEVVRTCDWELTQMRAKGELYRFCARLSIAGRIGSQDHHAIREIVHDLIANWSNKLIVDLQDCTLIDSQGIGLLVEARARAMERGGKVVLLNPVASVRQALDLIGILDVIPTFVNLSAAFRALESSSSSRKEGTS